MFFLKKGFLYFNKIVIIAEFVYVSRLCCMWLRREFFLKKYKKVFKNTWQIYTRCVIVKLLGHLCVKPVFCA